jgi:methionyl-tRNA formyltransferase
MRLILVTQAEPFFTRHFFRRFLSQYPAGDILGIVIQSTFNKQNRADVIKQAMGFFGLWGFFIMGLRFIGLRLAGTFSSIMGKGSLTSVESIACSHGVPILPFKSVNSDEFQEFIRGESIDLVVSVAASEIFKDEALNTPRLGCINIHSAPLPRYRGMMPNFWVLYNGEKKAWVTIHRMAEKLDNGPIIIQEGFDIIPGESYVSLATRSKEFAAGLLIKCIGILESGSIEYLPNNTAKATYFTFPTPQESRAFRKRGGRIV